MSALPDLDIQTVRADGAWPFAWYEDDTVFITGDESEDHVARCLNHEFMHHLLHYRIGARASLAYDEVFLLAEPF